MRDWITHIRTPHASHLSTNGTDRQDQDRSGLKIEELPILSVSARFNDVVPRYYVPLVLRQYLQCNLLQCLHAARPELMRKLLFSVLTFVLLSSIVATLANNYLITVLIISRTCPP
jgi:hypothetical protein